MTLYAVRQGPLRIDPYDRGIESRSRQDQVNEDVDVIEQALVVRLGQAVAPFAARSSGSSHETVNVAACMFTTSNSVARRSHRTRE